MRTAKVRSTLNLLKIKCNIYILVVDSWSIVQLQQIHDSERTSPCYLQVSASLQFTQDPCLAWRDLSYVWEQLANGIDNLIPLVALT